MGPERKDAMTPEAVVSKLTYDDLSAFPDDGKRRELIDGELYVTPSPNTRHQRLVGRLHRLIANHLVDRPVGEVFLAPFDVIVSSVDVVEPDLLFLSAEHADRITEKNVEGAPDLAVEVLSESTRRRDEKLKLRLYDRSDVAEYWIVDPETDVVKVHRRVDGVLGRVAELSADTGDVLTTPLLPGLLIPVRDLFA